MLEKNALVEFIKNIIEQLIQDEAKFKFLAKQATADGIIVLAHRFANEIKRRHSDLTQFNENNIKIYTELMLLLVEKAKPTKLVNLPPNQLGFESALNLIASKIDLEVKSMEDSYRTQLGSNSCDILLVSSKPTKENLKDLPIQSMSAYVRSGEKLFYINKKINKCVQVELSKEKLGEFDEAMKPGKVSKTLSGEELNKITSIIGTTAPHDPKNAGSYANGIKEIISPVFDLNLNWLDEIAELSVTDEINNTPGHFIKIHDKRESTDSTGIEKALVALVHSIEFLSNQVGTSSAEFLEKFYFPLLNKTSPKIDQLSKMRLILKKFQDHKSQLEENKKPVPQSLLSAITVLEKLYQLHKQAFIDHKIKFQTDLKRKTFTHYFNLQLQIQNALLERQENEDLDPANLNVIMDIKNGLVKNEPGQQEKLRAILGENYDECHETALELKSSLDKHPPLAGHYVFNNWGAIEKALIKEAEVEGNNLNNSIEKATDPANIFLPSAKLKTRLSEVVEGVESLSTNLNQIVVKQPKGTKLSALATDLQTQSNNYFKKVHRVGDHSELILKQKMVNSVRSTFNDEEIKQHVNEWKKIQTVILNSLLVVFAIPTLGATFGLKKLMTKRWTFHGTTNTQDELEKSIEKINTTFQAG